jgi:CRP-like cAMP-binding protein
VSPNRILARLSRADLSRLEPKLQAVEFPVRKQLHARNKRIEHVYFPAAGIASVVANGPHALEIGIIGRDGMTGVALVMGIDEPPRHETYIQVAGKGHRLSADHLREALEASATLRKVLLQYAHAFMTQMADTALSNGRHKIEERLARWLLLADDRLDDHQIPLTHEFLGVMLGTTRPGVTIALQELERRGWITNRRGVTTIHDRKGLVRSSNGAYLAPSDK